MSEKIAQCRNNPNHELFETAATVTQTWVVDAHGNFQEEASTDETLHKPSQQNDWACHICGGHVDFVDPTPSRPPTLELRLTVEYDPEQYDEQTARALLQDAGQGLMARGMVTGNTPMIVEEYAVKVVKG